MTRHERPTRNNLPAKRLSTEVALPGSLAKRSLELAEDSKSERTRIEYAKQWRKFDAWAVAHDFPSLPTDVATLTLYVTWLHDGQDIGRPLSSATIQQAVAAIKYAHDVKLLPLDTKDVRFRAVMSGARRNIAKRRTTKRVKPLLDTDLREILESGKNGSLRQVRDSAIIGLGFGAARRRNEIGGLDYAKLGTGSGVLSVENVGIVVTLMTSKTAQADAEQFIIVEMDAPRICKAVRDWIEMAKIEPGTPLFRGIEGNKEGGLRPAAARLSDRSIARVVKRRVYEMLKARHKGKKISAKDVKALADAYSGHSLRSGFVTSAANRGVANHTIRKTTGHKTDQMISVYSRESDIVKNNALKGSGL